MIILKLLIFCKLLRSLLNVGTFKTTKVHKKIPVNLLWIITLKLIFKNKYTLSAQGISLFVKNMCYLSTNKGD